MFLQCPAQVSAVSDSVVRWVVAGVVCDWSAMSSSRSPLGAVVPVSVHSLLWELCAQSQHALSNTVRTKCHGHVQLFPLVTFSRDVKHVSRGVRCWSRMEGKHSRRPKTRTLPPRQGAGTWLRRLCLPVPRMSCYLCAHTRWR